MWVYWLFQVIAVQITWWVGVLTASQPTLAGYLCLTLPLCTLQLILLRYKYSSSLLIAAIFMAILGGMIDSVIELTSAIHFSGVPFLGNLIPLWLWLIWLSFSLSVIPLIVNYRQYYWLIGLLAFSLFIPTYLLGAALGAAKFSSKAPAVLISLGLVYGSYIGLLSYFFTKLDKLQA
jgi:hypothetical protein